jgi:pyruvate/oxaloacetate carboxyltransferase
VRLLKESGIRQISLADTVGVATSSQIAETVAHVIAAHEDVEIGVHLHARPMMLRQGFALRMRRDAGDSMRPSGG